MARDGNITREKILDATEQLVLDNGFSGTSIDMVLEKTGITKGAFFYHFKNKAELADELVGRYINRDDALLHDFMARAEKLSRDPLQQYLIFIGLFDEVLRGLEAPHPGCLIASFTYQFQQFNDKTQDSVIKGFEEWQKVLGDKLDAAMAQHPTRFQVTSRQLVDNLLGMFEGGVILAKIYNDPAILAQQVLHHRNYIELLFADGGQQT